MGIEAATGGLGANSIDEGSVVVQAIPRSIVDLGVAPVPGSLMLSRSESRLPYACRQKIASMERAASIRSGMILRSFPLSLPRSAVKRTVVYWASFLSMGRSVVAELLARAFAGSL
ncbi:MAG TPA: hypothetical protein VGR09_15140 [Gemmatimonadales bacterium]|nr:hypothetical protein [Gemmatimonadales bacterium]